MCGGVSHNIRKKKKSSTFLCWQAHIEKLNNAENFKEAFTEYF